MPEQIYVIGRDGFEPLLEQSFKLEADLEEMLAEHPELLGGDQIAPDDPRRWLLIGRQVGIPDRDEGSNRWSMDLLLLDQDAIPTFVEVKLSSNPEIRRAIVGQMLEYAAHARHWPVDHLRDRFRAMCPDTDPEGSAKIAALLGSDGEPDIDAFWSRVSTNLDARRIRLLFVADQIPDPLMRVVEFINEEMETIEAFGVEVKQFRGNDSQTLVPRVRGRTAKPPTGGHGPRTTLTEQTFYEKFPDDQSRALAQRLLTDARSAGATLGWGSNGVSIRSRNPIAGMPPLSIAWIYPNEAGWAGTRYFSFGCGGGAVATSDLPPDVRDILMSYARQFDGDPFLRDVPGKDTSGRGVCARYGIAADIGPHVDELVGRIRAVLGALSAVGSAPD